MEKIKHTPSSEEVKKDEETTEKGKQSESTKFILDNAMEEKIKQKFNIKDLYYSGIRKRIEMEMDKILAPVYIALKEADKEVEMKSSKPIGSYKEALRNISQVREGAYKKFCNFDIDAVPDFGWKGVRLSNVLEAIENEEFDKFINTLNKEDLEQIEKEEREKFLARYK
ncbi:MAG: hypothetical protein WC499_03755 [Patescibacteria group bacterium]